MYNLNHSHYVQLYMLLMTRAWKMFNFESLNAYGKDLMRVKFRIYKELYGKPLKCDWVEGVVFLIQILLIFGSHCNRYIWDIGWKFTGYLQVKF